MTLEQVYTAIGGDYKGVMERLPSADFVRRFALKFLQDDSFPNLKKALEEKDAPTAFRAAHTLKGVCQNLGFDALYVPSSALTEALRGGSLDGVYELLQDDDGSLCVGVTVDNDGQSIPYFCVFSDLGQTVMIALSDDSGLNGLYFVQE